MNIPNYQGKWAYVISTIVLGVAANAVWAIVTRSFGRIDPSMIRSYVSVAGIVQLLYTVMVAGIGVFLGKTIGEARNPNSGGGLLDLVDRENLMPQSREFVLEVSGSEPVDGKPEWCFWITNCTREILRSIQLSPVLSEIEAYQITFAEIAILQPGEKVKVPYGVYCRLSGRTGKATLWDFAQSHAGERGAGFLWYDIRVRYRDSSGSDIIDGKWLSFCFVMYEKKLKTEGAEYFRKERLRSGHLSRGF